jgi:hypothetical protein
MTDTIPPKHCIITQASDNFVRIQHEPRGDGKFSSSFEFNLDEFKNATEFLKYMGYKIIKVYDLTRPKIALINGIPEFMVSNILEHPIVVVSPYTETLQNCQVWHYCNSTHFTATKPNFLVMDKQQFQSYAQGYSNAKKGKIEYV